ncbi:MAG: tripartite tricarboxylate transporter substrate binding protein [Actinobacteria bacterium]|nr:tripartite tricarboxylate transporter substrate binding protein [Actinomycetota bacterium]
MLRQVRRLIVGLSCTLLLGAAPVFAQDYPSRTIRIVVPFPPGGGPDSVARALAPRLAELLGKPVIVDNKPGASSAIGLDSVAKAAPDGYTIGVANVAFVANPSLIKRMPFDTEKDLVAISLVSKTPLVMVVHPSVPARTVKELLAQAKAKSGEMFYASAGNGTSNHLLTERLNSIAGVKMTHVPYKGAAPSVTAMLAGETSMLLASIPSTIQHIQSGRLIAIAVGSTKRLESLPDVPTIAEAVPGFEAADWVGFVAPVGTPPAIVQKLNQALVKIVQMPELRPRLLASGAEPIGTTQQEFAAFVKQEIQGWGKLIEDVGIKID